MEKMTLARALRYKKRVVETIRTMEQDIILSNSVIEGNDRDVDVRKTLRRRKIWSDHLVDLKLAIQTATRPVNRLVLELAETKAQIALYQRLPLQHGAVMHYGEAPIMYNAEIRKAERDGSVVDLQKRIDTLQSEIDTHNASTMIEINTPE